MSASSHHDSWLSSLHIHTVLAWWGCKRTWGTLTGKKKNTNLHWQWLLLKHTYRMRSQHSTTSTLLCCFYSWNLIFSLNWKYNPCNKKYHLEKIYPNIHFLNITLPCMLLCTLSQLKLCIYWYTKNVMFSPMTLSIELKDTRSWGSTKTFSHIMPCWSYVYTDPQTPEHVNFCSFQPVYLSHPKIRSTLLFFLHSTDTKF